MTSTHSALGWLKKHLRIVPWKPLSCPQLNLHDVQAAYEEAKTDDMLGERRGDVVRSNGKYWVVVGLVEEELIIPLSLHCCVGLRLTRIHCS